MPLFNVQYPTSPSMPRYGPNDGPNAGNQYEGFGGGAVGSVGATQSAGPWWTQPSYGGSSGPSFRPSAPTQPPVSAPARPTTTLPAPGARPATPSMSPADFFAQLAGLVGGTSAGQFNPYARPNVQMSPEVRARMNAPVGPMGMAGDPMRSRNAGASRQMQDRMNREASMYGASDEELAKHMGSSNPAELRKYRQAQETRRMMYGQPAGAAARPAPQIPSGPVDPLAQRAGRGGAGGMPLPYGGRQGRPSSVFGRDTSRPAWQQGRGRGSGPSREEFQRALMADVPGYNRIGPGLWQNAQGQTLVM
jgi:hypothetical protein